MKKQLFLLAASALLVTTLVPEQADARAGMRRGGYYGGRGVVVRPGYRGGYAYRGGYRRGWGPAVGVGLGAAALGAAAVGSYYGGYRYADPCIRQQQVYDIYGNIVWQPVRVC
jgi:hypothetical protein